MLNSEVIKMKQCHTKGSDPRINYHCLICLKRCLPSSEVGSKLNIPGDDHCPFLNKALEQYFIVQKLLDIPKKWYEHTLQQNRKEINMLKPTPDEWFLVCELCEATRIKPAWDVYQKIKELEEMMGRFKEEIKVKMKDSIVIHRRMKMWSGLSGEGADVEIRKIILPELVLVGAKKTISDSCDQVLPSVKLERPRRKFKQESAFITPDSDSDSSANGDINDVDWEPLNNVDHNLHDDANDIDWEPLNNVDDHYLDEDDNDEKISPPVVAAKKTIVTSSTSQRVSERIKKQKPRRRALVKKSLCSDKPGQGRSNQSENEEEYFDKTEKKTKSGTDDHENINITFPELMLGGTKENMSDSCGQVLSSVVKLEPLPPSCPQDSTIIKADADSDSCANDETNDKDWEPLDKLNDYFDLGKKLPKAKKAKTLPSSTSTAARRLVNRLKNWKPRPRELGKQFLCSQCGCYFQSAVELDAHTTKVHESRRDVQGRPYDCYKCTYSAQSGKELQIHLRNRHGVTNFNRCPKCHLKFQNFMTLKSHMESKHPGISGQELDDTFVSLKCPVCDRQFMRLQTLNLHKGAMHPELFEPVSKPLECTECDQRFMSTLRLEHHRAKFHSERSSRYVCDLCGQNFEFKSRLKRHVLAIHQEKRGFVCHICGVDYTRQTLLTNHYKKEHPSSEDVESSVTTTTEQFKCRHCELTSPYKAVIFRHMKTHKEKAGHTCDQCGNCYMSEQGLRRHLRINHPVTKENVPCPHCFKPFPSLEYMKVHVKRYCQLKQVDRLQPK